MTDREKLLALLSEFDLQPNFDGTEVHLVAHEGNVNGYSGFLAVFDFDSSGKFVDVGIWE